MTRRETFYILLDRDYVCAHIVEICTCHLMSIIPIKGLQFVSSNSPTKPPLTAPPPPSQAVCGQCSTLLDFQGCFLQALTRLQDQMLTMTDGSYPRSMGCLPPRLWGISWNAQLSSDTIVSHFWDGCWQPPIVGVAPRCSFPHLLQLGSFLASALGLSLILPQAYL